jgi:endonuclease/exonuclease/phosphatase family metal-dependent hydrolase
VTRADWRSLVAAFLLASLAPTPGSAQSAVEPLVVDVLTFNTALLPEIAADTRQGERAARMAPHLEGYDVLVLQEVFVNAWRDALLADLADAYPYRGDLVGRDGARMMPWRQDGGVVILSRWPVERRATHLFEGTCSGTDCLADKGIAYVALRVGERLVHVFGTHAQSVYGSDPRGVRAAQFAQFQAFVAAQAIPADEPVVLAGDFNADAFSDELDGMLATLRAAWPELVGEMRATWDPGGNDFAGGRRAQGLDYVLVSIDHAAPVEAWNRVRPLRDGDLDLSDHYAVHGRFVWE